MAKFCQKYMAGEMAKMQQYKDGNVSDSLVNVFHKMDDMLRDTKYQEEVLSHHCFRTWHFRGHGLEACLPCTRRMGTEQTASLLDQGPDIRRCIHAL